MKKQYTLSFLILLFSILMLPSSVFARDTSVSTLDVLYECPPKVQSIYLSETGGEVLLGSINSKDDLSVKIPVTSTDGVITGNVSVSTDSDYIVPASGISTLSISPGKTGEIPISVLVEKLPPSGYENVGFTVTFSYGKTSVFANFVLSVCAENGITGDYVFPQSASASGALINNVNTDILTNNSALICLREADGEIVLATENFGTFPKGTSYITGDGVKHTLFYDGYIKANGGQYVFITSPSAMPQKIVADLSSKSATHRQTITLGTTDDAPPLVYWDSDKIAVGSSLGKIEFRLSDKKVVHDADWESTSDGVDISYEIQKLENSSWIKYTGFALSSVPNTFGENPAEGKIAAEAVQGAPHGTYRLCVSQRLGNITISQLYIPFFIIN